MQSDCADHLKQTDTFKYMNVNDIVCNNLQQNSIFEMLFMAPWLQDGIRVYDYPDADSCRIQVLGGVEGLPL